MTSDAPPRLDGRLDEWDSRPAAWLAYDWGWSMLGRQIGQFHAGGEHFGYPPYTLDARAQFWTAWDAQNLYVALRLGDDQPLADEEDGERVDIHIGSNRLSFVAGVDGAAQLTRGNDDAAPIEIPLVSAATQDGWTIEAAIPWKVVGLAPEARAIQAFDLFWNDADRENGEICRGTLRWAGGARKSGYLLLGP